MSSVARTRKPEKQPARAPQGGTRANGAPANARSGGNRALGAVYSAGPAIGLAAGVQAKVAIGASNDAFEVEADSVADRVVSGGPVPAITPLPPGGLAQRQAEETAEEEPVQTAALQGYEAPEEEPVQRLGDGEEAEEDSVQALAIQRQDDEAEEEPVQALDVQRQADEEAEEEPVQTVAIQRQDEEEEEAVQADGAPTGAGGGRSMAAAAQHAVSHSGPGMPMASGTRRTLEARMGADLGSVRVHSGSDAQSANRALNARAFAHDRHIWLGQGESQSDLRLMAHETTHVLQQGGVIRRQELPDEQPPAPEGPQGPAAVPPAAPESGGGAAAGGGPAPPAPASGGGASGGRASQAPSAAEGASGGGGAGPPGPEAAPEAPAAEPEAAGAAAPATEAELLMPEPPEGLSAEDHGRLADVRSDAGAAAAAQEELPDAESGVDAARGAVTEPDEETQARAGNELAATLSERPAPSPEIEELCERIRRAIHERQPPDEDSLVRSDPQEEAEAAGAELESAVEGDVERVEGEYSEMEEPPEGEAALEPEALETPETSVDTPAIGADRAVPDAVPDENVSLDADVEASGATMEESGLNSDTANLVADQGVPGPVTDAHQAQGELGELAETGPADVLAEQMTARADAAADMQALQARALEALTASRTSSATQLGGQQTGMVGDEETTRASVGARAQQIFDDASSRVTGLLEPLVPTARSRWDTGVQVLSTEFETDLKTVQDWLDERYSGIGGAIVEAVESFVGKPAWVTRAYNRAEERFGSGVCALLREISTEINSVIQTCEEIIADARRQIDELFANLPDDLQAWAEGERARYAEQLDALHGEVMSTRDNLTSDLTESAASAVQEVRERIHELRQEAGGLVGRIIAAAERFAEDPARFLIEALLELVGIPPPAFWAVVDRIGQAIDDIADDPLNFANNLLRGIGAGFERFFENIGGHLLDGLLDWLFSGLGSVGVELPPDFSLKSIITFFLQLMGITWERIRRLLARHIGEENVALIEQAYEIISTLIELGPQGIFDWIKDLLNPQNILNMVLEAAVDFLIDALITAVTPRIIALFNPAGAAIQAIEAIYRVLSWIFENAARIFTLVETVVNGIVDIIAGNISGMAAAVESALSRLIAPVIDFLAGYIGLGDLPEKIADTIRGFQEWIESLLDRAIAFLAERARALLASLGFGEDEDPQDHSTIAARAVEELSSRPRSSDYPEARQEKEAQARDIEARYSGMLEEGVGLRVRFGDRASDKSDNDIDFDIEIGPNTTTASGSAPLAPTGLSRDDAIPIQWYKPDDLYVDSLEFPAIGATVFRNQPQDIPMGIEPGQTITMGVPARYWPSIGKTMQYVPEDRGNTVEQLRAVYDYYGASRLGVQLDHVQDLQFEGPDLPENIWPFDSSANMSAGPRQRDQQVQYLDNGGTVQTAKTNELVGRWFAIDQIGV